MRLLICLALVALQASVAPLSRMDIRPLEAAIGDFDGVVGIFARNLRTGEEIAINADVRFPTASAIKTAVMLEAYHRAAEGTVSLDDELTLNDGDKVGGAGVLSGLSSGLRLKVRDLIHLMIVLSDNTATNMLVNRLGTKRIDDRLDSYGLRDIRIFRPTFRDGKADVLPELEREFGLGMSTPRDMAKLMAVIAEGRAVNAEASKDMLSTLRRQQDRGMIPRLLPSNVQVGNKTGTDSEKLPDEKGRRGAIRTDAAIVTTENVQYVVSIFVRRGGDTRGGVDNAGVLMGARLSRMVFDLFTAAR